MTENGTIEERISAYAKKLDGLTKPEDKRVRKRVLQILGKLKKQRNGGGDEPVVEEPRTETGIDALTNRKKMKMKTKLLNKDLALCAKKKQLKLGEKKFEWGKNKGLEYDTHTYTNMMNIYVRCGRYRDAMTLFETMKSEGISYNIVTLTTLLKGFCENDFCASKSFFFDIVVNSGFINVRALNTFLRGCMRVGATKSSMLAYTQVVTSGPLQNSSRVEPDSSSIEYLVSLLAQSLRIIDMENVIADLTTDAAATFRNFEYLESSAGGTAAADNAAIYLAAARAYAHLGITSVALVWCDCASAALKRTESQTLRSAMMMKKSTHSKSTTLEDRESANCDLDEGVDDDDGFSGSSRSVALFLQHRREEISRDVDLIKAYTLAAGRDIAAMRASSLSYEVRKRVQYLNLLSRILYFGSDGFGDYDDGNSSGLNSNGNEHNKLCSGVIFALRDKFGLDAVARVPFQDNYLQSTNIAVSVVSVLGLFKKAVVRKVIHTLQEIPYTTPSSGTTSINFSVLFNTSFFGSVLALDVFARLAPAITVENIITENERVSAVLSSSHLPLKLEIGAGSGEWAIAQAAADWDTETGVPRALWVAMELRCDRVYDIACQAAFVHPDFFSANVTNRTHSSQSYCSLSNLAVIGGEALLILQKYFAPKSVDNVFINHPQPPERLGAGIEEDAKSTLASAGTHLLTADFFRELYRVLKASTESAELLFRVAQETTHPVDPSRKRRRSMTEKSEIKVRPCSGTLTIVTDNLPYAKLIQRTLAEISTQRNGPVFCSVSLAKDNDCFITGRVKLEEKVKFVPHVPGSIQISSKLSPPPCLSSSLKSDAYLVTKRTILIGLSQQRSAPLSPVGLGNDDELLGDTIKGYESDDDDDEEEEDIESQAPSEANFAAEDQSTVAAGLGTGQVTRSIVIWRGEAGDEAGHVAAEASSYFDRMWTRGQKKRRWFLYLKKL